MDEEFLEKIEKSANDFLQEHHKILQEVTNKDFGDTAMIHAILMADFASHILAAAIVSFRTFCNDDDEFEGFMNDIQENISSSVLGMSENLSQNMILGEIVKNMIKKCEDLQ